MADSDLKRGEPQHFLDNDPFAELTRIMARESTPGEAERSDPFDIDLEKELLGDLGTSFTEQDEFSGTETVVEETAAADIDRYVEAAVTDDFSATAEEPEMPVALAPATEIAPAAGEEIAPEAFDDAFASDFEDAGWQDGGAEMTPAATPVPVAHPDDWERAPLFETAGESADRQSADDDLSLADVDMDFGDLDLGAEDGHDGDAAEFGEAADVKAVVDEVVESAPAQDPAWEPMVSNEPSLEDELGMLLADDSVRQAATPAGESSYAEDWAYEGEVATSESDAAAPHIPLYGRANYPPAGDENPESELEVDDPETIEAEDRWAAEQDWSVSETEAAEGEEYVEADAATAEATQDERLAPEPEPDPFAVFSTIAPTPRPYAPAPVAAPPFDAVEEFETFEVPEAATPLKDDLDLPETNIGDEPPPAFDDYDIEFAQVFGDLGSDATPTEEAERKTDDQLFSETLGFDATATGRLPTEEYPVSSWYDSGRDYAAHDGQTNGTDDLEREIDVATYGTAAAPAARSRTGMYVAAAVVAVAVLGGVGVFALSSGDGAGDAPVLVQADNEPLKVKPENPGGTAVPNQDSKVYERVAGKVEAAPAAQERLVSTTEEPVDLTARAQQERADDENALPGVDEDIAALDETGTEMAAKSEERIELPSQEAAGVGAVEDLAAVQPRKVRTMIVRPDGTLVPREDPAPSESVASNAGPLAPQESLLQPAQPAESAQQTISAASAVAEPAAKAIREVSTQAQVAPATSEAPAQPVAPQPAAAAAASTETVTPSTGPIVQQRPVEQPQQQQQVAQAAAPARTQPAAPPPPAAAGEWSTQIASQPTAESAQATYQDLARRYGSIIGSHGVNIVRADIPGKGTYYRVRIPSPTRAEAISLCEKYKAAGGSCFVSK